MQTRGFLTCRDIAGFLADYLAGQIPSAAKAVFERHLEICADCVRYLRGYEATIALTRQAYDDTPSHWIDHQRLGLRTPASRYGRLNQEWQHPE